MTSSTRRPPVKKGPQTRSKTTAVENPASTAGNGRAKAPSPASSRRTRHAKSQLIVDTDHSTLLAVARAASKTVAKKISSKLQRESEMANLVANRTARRRKDRGLTLEDAKEIIRRKRRGKRKMKEFFRKRENRAKDGGTELSESKEDHVAQDGVVKQKKHVKFATVTDG